MNLIVYSKEPLVFDAARRYEQSTRDAIKPRGLWFSVEGQHDWLWWCEAEDFRLPNLAYQTVIMPLASARILLLESPKQLDDFSHTYGFLPEWYKAAGIHGLDSMWIDWPRVAESWQGLIIAPYQWSRRMDLMWYYGWDCASGCIWDLSAIATVGESQLRYSDVSARFRSLDIKEAS